MRRPVAWVTAIVLFVEAIGIGLVNWFMGIVVDRQDMSLAGLDLLLIHQSSQGFSIEARTISKVTTGDLFPLWVFRQPAVSF